MHDGWAGVGEMEETRKRAVFLFLSFFFFFLFAQRSHRHKEEENNCDCDAGDAMREPKEKYVVSGGLVFLLFFVVPDCLCAWGERKVGFGESDGEGVRVVVNTYMF